MASTPGTPGTRGTPGTSGTSGTPGTLAPWHSLLAALFLEIAVFSLVAPNFATLGNFFEVTRLSVELGLLAIALTPVIITGGIDLSVGSIM